MRATFVAVLLIAAACSGGPAATATPSVTQPPTPAVTPPATPAPTATPTLGTVRLSLEGQALGSITATGAARCTFSPDGEVSIDAGIDQDNPAFVTADGRPASIQLGLDQSGEVMRLALGVGNASAQGGKGWDVGPNTVGVMADSTAQDGELQLNGLVPLTPDGEPDPVERWNGTLNWECPPAPPPSAKPTASFGPDGWFGPVFLDSTSSNNVASDVAVGSDGLIVAVGRTDGDPPDEGSMASFVWTSTTGRDWTAVPDQESLAAGGMTSVAATDAGFIAVGFQYTGQETDGGYPDERATVWTSADGLTWTVEPPSAAFEHSSVQAIIQTATGLLAVGCTGGASQVACNEGAIWSSKSAHQWELAATVPGPGGGLLHDVAQFGSRTVAVGSSILVSDDELNWSVVDTGPDLVLGYLKAVLVHDDTLVAVGSVADESGNSDGREWALTSPDGQTWSRLARVLPEADYKTVYDAAMAGDRLVVVGTQEDYDVGVVWPLLVISAEWAVLDADPPDDARALVFGVASTPVGIVAVGAADPGPAVWWHP